MDSMPNARAAVPAAGPVAAISLTSLLLAVPVVVALGCGSGASDGHSGPRGQVRGTVTFDGKPVPAGSQVLFIGTRGGYTASGAVGADGTYRLAYSVAAGLPVGDYVVQIAPPAAAAAAPSADPSVMAQRMNLSAKGAGGAAKAPFPERYSATGTSGLTFSVAPGDNTADFALAP